MKRIKRHSFMNFLFSCLVRLFCFKYMLQKKQSLIGSNSSTANEKRVFCSFRSRVVKTKPRSKGGLEYLSTKCLFLCSILFKVIWVTPLQLLILLTQSSLLCLVHPFHDRRKVWHLSCFHSSETCPPTRSFHFGPANIQFLPHLGQHFRIVELFL